MKRRSLCRESLRRSRLGGWLCGPALALAVSALLWQSPGPGVGPGRPVVSQLLAAPAMTQAAPRSGTQAERAVPGRLPEGLLAQVPPPPRLSARAAILMDWQTGQVLHAREALTRRPPASTTKILTALIALERGRLSDRVTISRRAAATPGSSMSLRAGEVYTLHDLLRGLLLRSGNDAAVAIAEHIAGSVEAFAALMNERARELGARQSRFLNPHGLHQPGHYSTAYDLAVITRHALAHPVFAELVRQREALVGEGAGARVLSNTNRLLWHLPGADGVKTGTTSAAGECLVASATRPDPETGVEQKLIAVVLDADARWEDSAQLLNWGFEHFRLVPLAQPGDGLWEVPVRGGREPRIRVAPAAPLAVVVPRSLAGAPVLTFRLPPAAPAPVHPGTPLGTVEVAWGEWVLHQVPLVAAEEVAGAGWATWLVRPALPWLRWLGRQGWV